MRTGVTDALRSLLQRKNQVLAGEMSSVSRLLESSSIPLSLEPYRTVLCQVCSNLSAQIDKNLSDLALDEDSILEDILSNSRLVIGWVRRISGRLATPILRASDTDRLCLDVISWIHRTHQLTESLPAAFSDSPPAVLPLSTVPVYCFPCMEQRGLLYQPLLLHEFGHVLYGKYRRETDDLVREMQEQVTELLLPLSQRNDQHSIRQAERREIVVATWYSWIQEIFCDAVGLTMGGPAFLYAFSLYLGSLEHEDFWLPAHRLVAREHPISWLRVNLLVKRAVDLGLTESAEEISHEWRIVAGSLGIAEDYHGFYDNALEPTVMQTVDDMLTTTYPRAYSSDEVGPIQCWTPSSSPISLMNLAWSNYRADPSGYQAWEENMVSRVLNEA